jgi:hypothetical protein
MAGFDSKAGAARCAHGTRRLLRDLSIHDVRWVLAAGIGTGAGKEGRGPDLPDSSVALNIGRIVRASSTDYPILKIKIRDGVAAVLVRLAYAGPDGEADSSGHGDLRSMRRDAGGDEEVPRRSRSQCRSANGARPATGPGGGPKHHSSTCVVNGLINGPTSRNRPCDVGAHVKRIAQESVVASGAFYACDHGAAVVSRASGPRRRVVASTHRNRSDRKTGGAARDRGARRGVCFDSP